MSIENFDHGANKAAGLITIAFNQPPGTGRCAAIGIRSVVQLATGHARLELVEAIGESEFLALALPALTPAGEVSVDWVDDTHFDIRTHNSAGGDADGSAWFVIYKLGGNFGAVPVTGGGVA